MDRKLCLYVDRLKEGHKESISESLDPSEIDVASCGVNFKGKIQLVGEGYLAEGEVLFCFSLATKIGVPCSICNGEVELKVGTNKAYAASPLKQVKGGLFDLVPCIREELLLSLPEFVECSDGACPERSVLNKFLKKDGEDTYQPFAHL